MREITTTYRGVFNSPGIESLEKLDLLMRKYQSAKRFSRARLFEGQTREQIKVGAYYSSFIGQIKYQKMFGLSIHQSAALVLARRGSGFNERVPKQLVSVLFAKEAEKGHKINELFTHWKKAYKWYRDEIKMRYKLSPFVRKPSHWTDLLEDAFSF